MNKHQKIYCDTYYNGKIPRTNKGKAEYEMLGLITDAIVVYFPDGPKTFRVTEDDCNIPEGRISVRVLASNLTLWNSRGYKIQNLTSLKERNCRVN